MDQMPEVMHPPSPMAHPMSPMMNPPSPTNSEILEVHDREWHKHLLSCETEDDSEHPIWRDNRAFIDVDSVGSTDDIPFGDVELNTVDSYTILFKTKDRFKINSQKMNFHGMLGLRRLQREPGKK